jgi:hypothetical protein
MIKMIFSLCILMNLSASVPFKIETELEQQTPYLAENCLQSFIEKGGTLKCVNNLSAVTAPVIQLNKEDAVYPICSGGWCRSQSLWGFLRPYSDHIILFPPHAARVGWDPYNGQVNRYRNYAAELEYDEFSGYFGLEKTLRFGFENNEAWQAIEAMPTTEGLQSITDYYNEHYFGPHSSWQGRQGKKRIYIAFAQNAHVVLLRLCQANEELNDVTVLAVNSEDIITQPPECLNATPKSVKSYGHFVQLLAQLFEIKS